MRPTLVLLLAAFGLASAQSRPSARHATPSTVPNAFIVRLHAPDPNSRADPKASFRRKCTENAIPYDIRYDYDDPDLFYGLSISLTSDHDPDTLLAIPEVSTVSPVHWIQAPPLGSNFSASYTPRDSLHHITRDTPYHASPALSKRNHTAPADLNTPHTLTGVTTAHAANLTGAGTKIALIDSGIDWRHPALGGCFGPGCKVVSGYDFVGDTYGAQSPEMAPKDDPLTTCPDGGHGTHVAGIVGMVAPANETLFAGLVGVAPGAELAMYRVFSCSGFTSEDVILAAMQRAAADGADVVSMSLGGGATWGGPPDDPFRVVISGLKKRGVAVIAAAGNNGESTPFFLGAPAIAPEALAVASVENGGWPTYEVRDSVGGTHRYGSLYPFPQGEWSAVVVGNGTARSEFGCLAGDYEGLVGGLEGDLGDYVLVAKRGWCPGSVLQQVAVEAGFEKILTVPDPESDNIFIEGYAAPVVEVNANGTIVSFGATLDSGIFDAVKANKGLKLSFTDKTPVIDEQPWGGLINNFSSIGPSWDFSLKPQIAAPGGSILSTFSLEAGGWAIISGTSMATPYLSGVYALVKSQRPDLSVDEIFDLLKTTSKPVLQAGHEGYSPTQQQGAGLVSASSALFSESKLSPSQFELYGTETLAKLSPNITLHNPSDSPETYTLSHLPANGMQFFPYGDSVPNGAGYISDRYLRFTPLPFAATLNLSTTTVSIPAHSSASIPFTVDPPADLNPNDIPVYSGFITATSASTNETLSVPYIGVPYDYSAAPLIGLEPPAANTTGPAHSIFDAPQVYNYSTNQAQGDYAAYTFLSPDWPALRYSLLQPTRFTRIDVIAAETPFTPTHYGFNPANEVLNYTRTAMPTNGTIGGVDVVGTLYIYDGDYPLVDVRLEWTGPLYEVTGQAYIGLKKGGYRVLMRWLRWGGDEEKAEDWVSWLSGVVEVTRDAYAAPGEGWGNGTVGRGF